MVWKEGLLIQSFPAESYTIKTLQDSMEFLNTEDGQQRWNWNKLRFMFLQKRVQVWDLSSTVDASHPRIDFGEWTTKSWNTHWWSSGWIGVLEVTSCQVNIVGGAD